MLICVSLKAATDLKKALYSPLKMGWNRKEGRGNKILKKERKTGSRGGAIKRGGGLEPHYELINKLLPPVKGVAVEVKKLLSEIETSSELVRTSNYVRYLGLYHYETGI